MRDLFGSACFEVFNAGEWVVRKGMLNETFYVVVSGAAKVILDESNNSKFRGARRGSAVLNVDRYVAELVSGDVFGEMSSIYRSKCVASVTAATPLEVIAFPRPVFMRTMHRHPAMLSRFVNLVKQRKKENYYFRFGKLTVGSTASKVMAIALLRRVLLRRILRKREEKLEEQQKIQSKVQQLTF